MPRFFFNIVYGERVRAANEGLDLPDEDAAWREAIVSCSELIADLNGDLRSGDEWRLDVTDENGAVRFRLRVSAEIDPKA